MEFEKLQRHGHTILSHKKICMKCFTVSSCSQCEAGGLLKSVTAKTIRGVALLKRNLYKAINYDNNIKQSLDRGLLGEQCLRAISNRGRVQAVSSPEVILRTYYARKTSLEADAKETAGEVAGFRKSFENESPQTSANGVLFHCYNRLVAMRRLYKSFRMKWLHRMDRIDA